MQWTVIVAILILAGTALFIVQNQRKRHELFADYYSSDYKKGPDSIGPLIADFHQGLPLADVLAPASGLTNMSASSCAAADKSRQEELGGQYVQRTNNYRHDYPDDCSSLMSDFVGGFYAPKEGAIGSVVPCDGQC